MTPSGRVSNSTVVIRDLESIEDLRKVEPVEREVWGLSDRDVAPMTLLIACKEAGSILIGAFDEDELVGFAFGFPSLEHGALAVHSHMLAVLSQYRDLDLGYKLKLAQRDRALAKGIKNMSWTFDPLQSRNAHFNFAKLGVLSDSYKVDFYGSDSSSLLHQNGTDRLWLTWPMDSPRVQKRLSAAAQDFRQLPSDAVPVVMPELGGRPAHGSLPRAIAAGKASIAIPADIVSLERRDRAIAWEWRLATRWGFTELLKSGFVVTDYFRPNAATNETGAYVLEAGSIEHLRSAS
jgi:predicted GNAT superfamily acetyltransferase